eukprot:CAMPEP_0201954854 /NCGR_PEP_ID=MMETSP0904-20121228/2677_1 /ASSEMBLY_ACC=CAM_ASM_000553 /TAXON_ID=420261 /ORGANISM="Thalassiosira antarctica, Strain CCMP982" /LENGTH=37 /DNA_ID= /DNA_START= /DNA_END= /DNA_ORIENTATION=
MTTGISVIADTKMMTLLIHVHVNSVDYHKTIKQTKHV